MEVHFLFNLLISLFCEEWRSQLSSPGSCSEILLLGRGLQTALAEGPLEMKERVFNSFQTVEGVST